MQLNEQIRLYNLSLNYLHGRGVPQDSEKSFELNAEVAEYGYRDAVLAMGWYYLGGVGVKKNLGLAWDWYRKSARHGEPMAMFSLGVIAHIRKDYSSSLTWFTRASKYGHARSLYWIGKQHWYGRGVPKDKKEAMKFFHLAAGKKNVEARRALQFLTRHKTSEPSN